MVGWLSKWVDMERERERERKRKKEDEEDASLIWIINMVSQSGTSRRRDLYMNARISGITSSRSI